MNSHARRHHGMAYLMVMLALSVAGILGMATLASTSLSVQAAASHQKSAQARCATDSAVQAALYGLQYPTALPSSWTTTSGHAIYATGVSIDATSGTFDVDATSGSVRDVYTITATGHAASDPTFSRSSTVSMELNRAKPVYAGVFAAPTTVANRCSFVGAVLSSGTVTLSGTGTISGSIKLNPTSTDFAIPTAATINYYGAGSTPGTYTMPDGVTTGTPEALAATITSFPAASSFNPGHVFYANSDLTITTTTTQTLNGTLIVKGNLTITGIGGAVVVTPIAKMPAVITAGYIKPNSRNLAVTLNGVVWSGAGWTWGSALAGTVIKVNGCLMLPSGATLGNLNSASILATYTAANADVPDIAVTPQPVTGVHVLTYAEN